MDAVRAMLDELMGKERDVPLEQRGSGKIRWDDPLVCKYTVCGLCPHKLFKNTKSDLGPCPYEYHDDHIEWPGIQADYDKERDSVKERHERALVKVLEDLIREMDRKIAKNKDRAAAESAPRPLKPEEQARLTDLQNKAKDLLQRSQEAGEQGEVDASMALAQQAEEVQGQHDRLAKQLATPDRTMTVCEICGVFINSTDNEQRRLDHLTGKQYLGWKAIREKHAELVAKLEKPSVARSSREPEERERERDRDRDRDSTRESGRDKEPRDRDRERERDRGERTRERERDPRDYDRERSRDYPREAYREGHRDRDREREYRRGSYDDRRPPYDDRRGPYDDRRRGHDAPPREYYEDRRRY